MDVNGQMLHIQVYDERVLRSMLKELEENIKGYLEERLEAIVAQDNSTDEENKSKYKEIVDTLDLAIKEFFTCRKDILKQIEENT